jgi:hypothetical protein
MGIQRGGAFIDRLLQQACASLVLAVNESGSTGVSRSCFWLRRYSTICIKAVMVPSGVR